MNTDYKVGDLIYDASIYDGLNTFLSVLQFYKKWLPKNRMLKYLNFVVEQADLRFQLQRMDTIFVESITLHPCLNKQRQKPLKQG